MLEQVEAGELVYDLKMNVLQAIQYIIQGWDEITANTIQNCWNHVKILPDASFPDDIYEDDDLMLDDELTRAIEALNLSNRMGVREFITIPEEEEVYEIPEILEIADLFKRRPLASGGGYLCVSSINHPDEIDDSIEVETICINEASQSLKNIRMFLLQQENASEQIKLVGKIEKFIKKEQINLMQQTTIDQYFE